MRRIKGGVHCQRKYRARGWHPLVGFNQAMAKRRNDLSRNRMRTLAVLNDSQLRAQEARNRLGITPEQMRRVPRIAPILECVEGGVESVIEALRFSHEGEAAHAFLRKYDSVAPADLPYLSIDEISIASGTDPWRLLTLAVDGLLKISVMKTQIELYGNLPGVTKAMVKIALTDKGTRDRRLLFQIAGILPTAHPAGPLAVPSKTRTQKPEARPAVESPAARDQPWLRTLPSKTR